MIYPAVVVSVVVGLILAVVVKAWMPIWGLEGKQPIIVAVALYGAASGGLWYIYNSFATILGSLDERRPWWQELGIIAAALVAPLLVLEVGGRIAPYISNLWDAFGNM